MAKLNNKQVVFCEHYISNGFFNATKAAIDAGYTITSARTTAYKLLREQGVIEYIEERKKELVDKTNLTIEWRLNQLARIVEVGQNELEDGKAQGLPASIRAIEVINSMLGTSTPEDDELQGTMVHIGVEDCSKDEDE